MPVLSTHFQGLIWNQQPKVWSLRTEHLLGGKKGLKAAGSQISALYDCTLLHWLIALLEDRILILQKVRGTKKCWKKNQQHKTGFVLWWAWSESLPDIGASLCSLRQAGPGSRLVHGRERQGKVETQGVKSNRRGNTITWDQSRLWDRNVCLVGPAVRYPKVKDGLETVLCDPVHFPHVSDEKNWSPKRKCVPLESHNWLVAEQRPRARTSNAPLNLSSLPCLH